MRLLCVDTATPLESLGLVVDGTPVAERLTLRPKGHGPAILDAIHGLLTDVGLGLTDVDGLVCGLGPGSFTGLRIALATLKGLAMGAGKPIYGVRTTLALCASMPGRRVAALLDAHRGEVFVDAPGLVPSCLSPERAAAKLAEFQPEILLGDGAVHYAERLAGLLPEALIPVAGPLHVPRASLLAGLIEGPAALATLEPVYVRRSDAEINYPDGFPDAHGAMPV